MNDKEDLLACVSCYFMDAYSGSLEGVDQLLYAGLASPIVAILAGIATVVLLFSTKVRTFVKTFAPEMDQQRWFMSMWLQSGKLVLVAIALTSYGFWHDWVIAGLDFIIMYIADIVIAATTSALRDAAGGLPADQAAAVFSGNSASSETRFTDLMRLVHKATYNPIEIVSEGFKGGYFNALQPTNSIAFAISWVLLNAFAGFSNLMFFLVLAMHKTMTVFVVGLGPLIMALWVFDQTKHYAYSILRFMLATGSIVIGTSFLLGMGLAVITKTATSALPGIASQEPSSIFGFIVGEANSWVTSPEFVFLIAAYASLAILMLMAALVGAATVLAQRPKLES